MISFPLTQIYTATSFVYYVICTHQSASAHDVVHWGKHQNGFQHHASPLMTLNLLSVFCLFYYVVWLDFMPVNVTFVCQFLPMDSKNDL